MNTYDVLIALWSLKWVIGFVTLLTCIGLRLVAVETAKEERREQQMLAAKVVRIDQWREDRP